MPRSTTNTPTRPARAPATVAAYRPLVKNWYCHGSVSRRMGPPSAASGRRGAAMGRFGALRVGVVDVVLVVDRLDRLGGQQQVALMDDDHLGAERAAQHVR